MTDKEERDIDDADHTVFMDVQSTQEITETVKRHLNRLNVKGIINITPVTSDRGIVDVSFTGHVVIPVAEIMRAIETDAVAENRERLERERNQR